MANISFVERLVHDVLHGKERTISFPDVVQLPPDKAFTVSNLAAVTFVREAFRIELESEDIFGILLKLATSHMVEVGVLLVSMER